MKGLGEAHTPPIYSIYPNRPYTKKMSCPQSSIEVVVVDADSHAELVRASAARLELRHERDLEIEIIQCRSNIIIAVFCVILIIVIAVI